jgi:hypothetical protein
MARQVNEPRIGSGWALCGRFTEAVTVHSVLGIDADEFDPLSIVQVLAFDD